MALPTQGQSVEWAAPTDCSLHGEDTMTPIHRRFLRWLSMSLLALALATPVLAQAETFQCVYGETGQFIKAIDSTGTVIEYVYDDVGNLIVFKYFAVNSGMNEW